MLNEKYFKSIEQDTTAQLNHVRNILNKDNYENKLIILNKQDNLSFIFYFMKITIIDILIVEVRSPRNQEIKELVDNYLIEEHQLSCL